MLFKKKTFACPGWWKVQAAIRMKNHKWRSDAFTKTRMVLHTRGPSMPFVMPGCGSTQVTWASLSISHHTIHTSMSTLDRLNVNFVTLGSGSAAHALLSVRWAVACKSVQVSLDNSDLDTSESTITQTIFEQRNPACRLNCLATSRNLL